MVGNRHLPVDLLLVAGFVLITNIFVLMPIFSDSFLRTCLGIFLVLFLPGYALAGALFPAKKDLEGIERATISFGLSIAIVPILGLGLNYSSLGNQGDSCTDRIFNFYPPDVCSCVLQKKLAA